MRLWRREILRDLVGSFLFILGGIFAMYVIVDFAERAKGASFLVYYLGNFSLNLDFFFPLAFLLASLKVLLRLNLRHQLVALQMSGLSRKTILTPFFCVSLILSSLSLLNTELLFPRAYEAVTPLKKKKSPSLHLHSMTLEDNSHLVYQSYDSATHKLFDVLWIRDKGDVWLMKHLDVTTPPLARDVHHIVRLQQWEQLESAAERSMGALHIDPKQFSESPARFQARSITSLYQQLGSKIANRPAVKSHLFYKIARPLLSPLILILIAPMAMRFSRNRSLLLPFGCALLGFFGFMTILDGMLILGETGALPASLSIWGPFGLCLVFALRPFAKL